MKARKPHPFFVYASNFTLESMLESVSSLAQFIYCNPTGKFGSFAVYKDYQVEVNGKKVHGKAFIVQTWLIDLEYTLIAANSYGKKSITRDESLHLIALFNDYMNIEDGKQIRESKEALLFVFGMFGEQKSFQNNGNFLNTFSREKYILEKMPQILKERGQQGINIEKEFEDETGFSIADLTGMLFIAWVYYTSRSNVAKYGTSFYSQADSIFMPENFWKVVARYSCEVDEIRTNTLKRQVLYKYPIVRFGQRYLSLSPFLLLKSLSNAAYWIMRDRYYRIGSQSFINEFGVLFEAYVEEILNNCLDRSEFERIACDNREKRADWRIKLGEYEMIVEQKSSLSTISAKQSHPDIKAIKDYIKKTWGEAVRQLDCTKAALSLDNPIKVILNYDDYYQCEIFEKLFELDPELNNDGKYWLLSIGEFESLLFLYRSDPKLALEIIKEKDEAEVSFSNDGRDLETLLFRHQIETGKYLEEFGVTKQFRGIIDLIIEKSRR